MLTEAVSNLKLSDECKCYLEGLKIYSLQEFICKGWNYYYDGQKRNTVLFNEVISLLLKNDLLYLMEGK